MLFVIGENANMTTKCEICKTEYTECNADVALCPKCAARKHVEFGINHEDYSRMHAAIDEYQIAISIDPSNAEAYVQLGKILCKQGDYERGVSFLENALYYDPDMPNHEDLANAFHKLNHPNSRVPPNIAEILVEAKQNLDLQKNKPTRRCPQCDAFCPAYRKTCKACGFLIGRKDV